MSKGLTPSTNRGMTSLSDGELESSPTVDPVVELGLPSPILLGSGSFTRRLILDEMGIKYVKVVKPIDERGIGDRTDAAKAADLVLTLAVAKAEALVSALRSSELRLPKKQPSSRDGWIVLTADQVVTHDSLILEKPNDVAEANYFVEQYAKSPPTTVGACVLTHIPSGTRVSGVDTATIVFRPSIQGVDLVRNLLDDGAPVLDCAGGLMVEHPLVKQHIDTINGAVDSVMGLSKDLVLRLLSEITSKLDQRDE